MRDVEWRVGRLGRIAGFTGVLIFAVAFPAGVTAVNIYAISQTGNVVMAVFLPAFYVLFGWVARDSMRRSLHPCIRLSGDSLIIRNPTWTHHLALAEIVEVRAGYSGVIVRTDSGECVSAWAVQKSNLTRWLRIRTRADRVVETLAGAAEAARGAAASA